MSGGILDKRFPKSGHSFSSAELEPGHKCVCQLAEDQVLSLGFSSLGGTGMLTSYYFYLQEGAPLFPSSLALSSSCLNQGG